tara:strand:- start:9435 stop:10967 length:1533 start_codon:yes stop_codon:yes gene_type:complete
MKYSNLIKMFSVIATVLVIGNSCTDDFESLNTDPSLLTKEQLDEALLLTKVQKEVFISDNKPTGRIASFAGYWASGGGLIFDATDYGGEFNKGYNNLLNISEIIRLTNNNPEKINRNAIARVMRVYIFQYLTDLYGDIPYSEAVQPSEEVIAQPKYDTQESIYKDMLNELKEAAGDLDENSTDNFGSADLIYAGDIIKWKKLANSLRLRLALRVRYVDPSLASTEISDVLTSDFIQDNSENAFVTTSDDFESNQNSLYNEIVFNNGAINGYMGKAIIDILNEGEDPRRPIMATPTPRSVALAESQDDPSLLNYRGRPIGLLGENEFAMYQDSVLSKVGVKYRQPIVDLYVMDYSEVCFALAESKSILGLGQTDADTWYKRGVRANMELHGVDNAEIDEFMLDPIATLQGNAEEQLEQIIRQKSVALFPNIYEAFAEWRRTGYPKILIGSMVGDTDGQIPRRLTYPFAEANFNSFNYEEASDRIGGDGLLTKVWWDANPNVPFEHPGSIFD